MKNSRIKSRNKDYKISIRPLLPLSIAISDSKRTCCLIRNFEFFFFFLNEEHDDVLEVCDWKFDEPYFQYYSNGYAEKEAAQL
jgi:hypothetical protein